MGLSIVCVWCGKPLLDVEHAKKHVEHQCEVAPWRKRIAALEAQLASVRMPPLPFEPLTPWLPQR